jgi:hypothetical protein
MTQRGDTRPNTLAAEVDQLFIDGASVAEVAENANQLAAARGLRPWTEAYVRRHLRYREERGWRLDELGGGRFKLSPPVWHWAHRD